MDYPYTAYDIKDLLKEHGFEFEWSGSIFGGWTANKGRYQMHIYSLNGTEIKSIFYSVRD